MKVLKAIKIPALKGIRRLLPPLALTWIFVFLLCLNSYAGNAEDLINAAQTGDISTVKALLAKGTDVNAKMNDGGTALSLAKGGRDSEIARLLIKAGAKE